MEIEKKSFFKVLYSTFFVLVFLSFLFMFMGLGNRNVDNSFDDKTYEDFSDRWRVQVDNGIPFETNLPAKLKTEDNAKVVLSKNLPENIGHYNSMLLESKRQELYVYVDGELRASYTDNGQKIGNSLPSAYLMVPIYNTDGSSRVSIEFRSNTYYSGNISKIYLGSEESIILMLIKSNVVWLAAICVIAIIGAVCLTCYLLYRSTFSESKQFLHLFLFSLFTVVWCFSQIKIRQVFVKDLPILESIGHCCFLLIPPAVLLISDYFSNNIHPRFHTFSIGFGIVNFLGQNIAHTALGFDYFQMETITQLFLFWVLTTCIGGCAIDTWTKRVKGKIPVIVGFFGMTAGIVLEAIFTGRRVQYIQLSFYIIGSLIFVVAIAFNTFVDFREAQKAVIDAENASRAKSQFLATMSHEIRTPINVVLGMNEMVLREATNDTIRGYAGNIAEAGKSLLALVNDILDFSKIESGKMDIVCVDYNIKSLLSDLIMMTRTRIEDKDIKLIVDIDETIPSKYYGDEVRLKQILTNILTNSVKYTESGSITFSVKKVEGQEDKGLLRFSVKDTGMGMKPENIETLMSSSFVRFDETKNRNIEGTGLGVSIIRQLLSLMGSELKVESVYGQGSDFYFELKQGVVDETPMGPVEQKTNVSRAKFKGSFKAKAAKVLAVDDTKTNLLVIKGLLKPYEMNVETAASGEECINKCKENQYDVILMDHMMPGMDGIETLKVLNTQQIITTATRVIALTANAISGAEEMYISNGFDGYLTKPIDVASLEACLIKHLPDEKIERIEN